ncbi:ABC transporter substrate-binding protein [Cohnella sp. CIP 111063]|uniref:extracellular solute-binding protein n=1 Tax=unclassified Cohnella TaxID=2636738 RepID=UPI000B8C09BD|nr:MULTISPECIES: extracellular solute-binding protein [unclassified Cohnella]OXS56210.1 ABC transporter substrate-binding protein [Cohnella sp. CIP 111063]PRX67845.1 putative aldouronate transport system substrate-binding protein [Cohnella sp. SGD-V74]
MFKKKSALLILAFSLAASSLAACSSKKENAQPSASSPPASASQSPDASTPAQSEDPIKFSVFYSDNATLPFKEDWLTVQEVQKRFNADIKFEVIPIADYQTKVSLALNTGNNAPDVILYQSTKGENASLALNGALVPISDYSDWTPNFNERVKSFGLEDQVASLNLKDGKRYYLPSLYDKPFYDGGLILREDLLEKYSLQAPKTFDDLYTVLKKFKEENPDSYPLTILAGPRVLYRMTMPSFGVSVGKNGASGTNTLSWDYANQTYFPGAISDQYKEYMAFFSKLYAEGLLDPEMAEPIDGDKWSQKMATGKSFATYAYYDQIGGVASAATEAGFKLQMFPPLAGPAGAHHQPKSSTGSGILFPKKTADRPDFERLVRTIDEMFFSEEGAKIWGLGAEGTTYTMDGDKIKYADDIVNSPNGIYKEMQLKYGAGSDVTQLVWINAQEMTKYDENYGQINAVVAAMPDAIQAIPPTPLFDDMVAEEAASLQTPLADTFEIWADAFLTGKKSLDKDWDQYVKEMKGLQIERFAQLYNDNLK